MELVQRLETSGARAGLIGVSAASFLHGVVATTHEGMGWVRPWRFTSQQVRSISSCLAWHPGLYRQMAFCTAGIWLEFDTDASEIALEVQLDEESHGTAESLQLVDGDGPRRIHDGFSVTVGTTHAAPITPIRVGEGKEATTVVAFSLSEIATTPVPAGIQHLPGIGEMRRVRLFLPCLRGCVIRTLFASPASQLIPVPARPLLLVLGDSLAQGFVCDDPAFAWPTLVADELGLDVVNQGVGGQVVQVSSLADVPKRVSPAMVIVEYGGNYRYEPCRADVVRREIKTYLDLVERAWPTVPCTVMSTTWFSEKRWSTHPRSCFPEVASFLKEAAQNHKNMSFIDGMELLGARDAHLLADGLEHPNAEGNKLIAKRLLAHLHKEMPQKTCKNAPLPLDFAE